MTNKVRPAALGLPVADTVPTGPALYMTTRGTAAIRDDGQTLRSKRYLATMTLQAEGWILDVNAGGTFGPFSFAEEAFDWYLEHEGRMPESTWHPYRREAWPPGIEEDWAGKHE